MSPQRGRGSGPASATASATGPAFRLGEIMSDERRPPKEKVFEIADGAGGPQEQLQRLAEAFPNADPQYIRQLFEDRLEALD